MVDTKHFFYASASEGQLDDLLVGAKRSNDTSSQLPRKSSETLNTLLHHGLSEPLYYDMCTICQNHMKRPILLFLVRICDIDSTQVH